MKDPGPRRKRFPTNPTTERVGINLERYILHRTLAQEAIALELGVHRGTVSRWITGQAEPRAEERAALARLLRVRAAFRFHFLYIDPATPVEDVLLK